MDRKKLTQEQIDKAFRMFYGDRKSLKEIMEEFDCGPWELHDIGLQKAMHLLKRQGGQEELARHTVPPPSAHTLVLVRKDGDPQVHLNAGAWGRKGGESLAESIVSGSPYFREGTVVVDVVGTYEQRVYKDGKLVERNEMIKPARFTHNGDAAVQIVDDGGPDGSAIASGEGRIDIDYEVFQGRSVEDFGFADKAELVEMVMRVDLQDPEAFNRFEDWKAGDGRKDTLEDIIRIGAADPAP